MATQTVHGVGATRELAPRAVPLMLCRNEDGSSIDASGGAGLFKLNAAGFGSGGLDLLGEEALSNTKTDVLCFEVVVPFNYDSAADLALLVHAAYGGTGTPGTVTIDAEVYELDEEGVPSEIRGSDPDALTNSYADYTFADISEANLVPGDRLLVFLRTVIQETAGVNPLFAVIGSIELHIDLKG